MAQSGEDSWYADTTKKHGNNGGKMKVQWMLINLDDNTPIATSSEPFELDLTTAAKKIADEYLSERLTGTGSKAPTGIITYGKDKP